MSGGHFDYDQYKIGYIADSIEKIIEDPPEGTTEKTLDEMRKGVKFLRMAEIYAQRIDWFVCGDDGEETFHQRLAKDLKELGENNDR